MKSEKVRFLELLLRNAAQSGVLETSLDDGDDAAGAAGGGGGAGDDAPLPAEGLVGALDGAIQGWVPQKRMKVGGGGGGWAAGMGGWAGVWGLAPPGQPASQPTN
jgi:hypothetical protein